MPRYRNTYYHSNLAGGFSGETNPGGVVFYVAASGYTAQGGKGASDSNDGRSPQTPFATIQKGLDSTVSGRGDIVAVLPGSYTVTAALTIDNDDVKLKSAVPVGRRERSPVVIVNATDVNTVEVNANNVVIEGIEFDDNVATATANTAVVAVNTSNTATDYNGFKIVNCFLDMIGSDSDRDGITLGLAADATDGAIGALVQGCTIFDCDQDAIKINVGSDNAVVRDVFIKDDANTTRYGVEVLATGVSVEDSDIWTSTAGGACIHNGVAAARLNVSGCHLFGFSTTTNGILAVATATQQTVDNWIVSGATGYHVDYTTDNTTPSADAFISNFFQANAAVSLLDQSTVGHADA